MANIRLRIKDDLGIMEGDVSRSFDFRLSLRNTNARTLRVDSADAVTTADAEAGSWIRGFSRFVNLGAGDVDDGSISKGRSISRPIPRVATRRQIPPRSFCSRLALTGVRPHPSSSFPLRQNLRLTAGTYFKRPGRSLHHAWAESYALSMVH